MKTADHGDARLRLERLGTGTASDEVFQPGWFLSLHRSTLESSESIDQIARMLMRLIHASRACPSGNDDLTDILARSRAHNPDLGITGTLCLLDGTCIEHLEGEEAEIRHLFEHIRRDA